MLWKNRKIPTESYAFSTGNPVENRVYNVENIGFPTRIVPNYQQFIHTGELPT